jgi:hypothetical protein
MRCSPFAALGPLAGGLLLLALSAAPAQQRPQRETLNLNSWEAKAVRALGDERDPKARAAAARRLGYSKEVKLIPLVAHYAAYDPEMVVRDAASRALTQLRGRADRWEPPARPRVEREAGLVASEYKGDKGKLSEAREACTALTGERNAHRRAEAARALGRIGGPEAIPLLAYAAAYDADSSVRTVASRGVEHIRQRDDRWAPPEPPRFEIPRDPPRADFPDRDVVADMIADAVEHYLGREARSEEIRNWRANFERGGTYYAFLAVVLSSDEYFQRCGGEPGLWLERMFVDFLRRSPSEDEFRQWDRILAKHRGDRLETAKEFIQTYDRERSRAGYGY